MCTWYYQALYSRTYAKSRFERFLLLSADWSTIVVQPQHDTRIQPLTSLPPRGCEGSLTFRE